MFGSLKLAKKDLKPIKVEGHTMYRCEVCKLENDKDARIKVLVGDLRTVCHHVSVEHRFVPIHAYSFVSAAAKKSIIKEEKK